MWGCSVLSHSLSLSLSLSLFLSIYLYIYLSLLISYTRSSLSLSLSPFLSLSFSLYLSIYLFISLSLRGVFFFSFSFFLFMKAPISKFSDVVSYREAFLSYFLSLSLSQNHDMKAPHLFIHQSLWFYPYLTPILVKLDSGFSCIYYKSALRKWKQTCHFLQS